MRLIALTHLCCALVLLVMPRVVLAHPIAENAVDVVIWPDKVVIDARVTGEEVMVVEGGGAAPPPAPFWGELPRSHGEYVLQHLQVKVDGKAVEGRIVEGEDAGAKAPATTRPEMPSLSFRFVYPLSSPPEVVRIDQTLLREYEPWTAACVVRVRQSTDETFETALLTRERSVEYGCDWSNGAATRPAVAATRTEVRIWPTFWAYFVHGVEHIVGWDAEAHLPGGLDHILFVCALVLAATSVWDVAKVVTAFTVAHTLTLTLSVLNVVALSNRVVEPMIATSIVVVALQNVLWPRSSRGWARLGVAFAFGLFHGLGFAGGLKEAMGDLPARALGTALAGFSIGVEAGHQVVVIPLFAVLLGVRRSGDGWRGAVADRVARWGSAGISVAGVFFLIRVVKELY